MGTSEAKQTISISEKINLTIQELNQEKKHQEKLSFQEKVMGFYKYILNNMGINEPFMLEHQSNFIEMCLIQYKEMVKIEKDDIKHFLEFVFEHKANLMVSGVKVISYEILNKPSLLAQTKEYFQE